MAKKPNHQRSQRKSNLISMLMSHRRWRWLFYFAVISGRKSKYNFTGVYLVFKEKISVKIGGYYEKTT